MLTSLADLATRPGDALAERVGRYEPIAELAASPIGALWAARIASGREEGRLVTLRRIARRPDDPELVERVSEAAFSAMEVRHPKIAAVLDVVVTDREVAVASEYVDAQVLRALLRSAGQRRSPLPPNVALRLAVDLLQALRAAKQAWGDDPEGPPLHGGVGPDSVLVATFGDVMLADLGVAAVLAASAHVARDPEAIVYRAPEQLQAAAKADERCDVFSIGVMLWELLVNRPLFGMSRNAPEGMGELQATIDRVRAQPIERIDELDRQGPPVPAPIVELVARALERDTNKRFESLDAIHDALLALARGTVASPEQVVVALDRLARPDIEARRAALASIVAHTERESAPPESGRPTKRPPLAEKPTRIATGGTPAIGSGGDRAASPKAPAAAPGRVPPRVPLPRPAPRPGASAHTAAEVPKPAETAKAAQPSAEPPNVEPQKAPPTADSGKLLGFPPVPAEAPKAAKLPGDLPRLPPVPLPPAGPRPAAAKRPSFRPRGSAPPGPTPVPGAGPDGIPPPPTYLAELPDVPGGASKPAAAPASAVSITAQSPTVTDTAADDDRVETLPWKKTDASRAEATGPQSAAPVETSLVGRARPAADEEAQRRKTRTIVAIAGGGVALILIIVLLRSLFGGSEKPRPEPTASAKPTPTTHAEPPTPPPPPPPPPAATAEPAPAQTAKTEKEETKPEETAPAATSATAPAGEKPAAPRDKNKKPYRPRGI